jgi:outer membrane protein TolC
MPLMMVGLWAADTLTTPEQLYPQLDAILKKAVAQSPRMISRAIELEIAEQDRIVARAGMLPTAGGYYSYNEARDKRADRPGENLDVTKVAFGFTITQPLYHWGERRNTARMGTIRKTMAEGNYSEAYRLFAQELRSQYLRLIISKLRAERASFANKYSAKLLARGEERLAKKVISEAQIFNIRMEAERAQIADDRVRFDFENDKASFARLVGQPVLADTEIPDAIPGVADENEAIQRLLSGFLSQKEQPNYEAATYRNSMAIERLNLANQKTRLKPKLNFVIGTSQDEQSYSLNVAQKYQVTSYYAGVGVNWTVFDGFSARSGVRSSQARLRMMENDYRGLTERLAQDAQYQAKATGFSARNARLYDRTLESSEGSLRTRKEEFARGTIAEEDVGVSEINLYDSRIGAYTARADYYSQVCLFLGTVTEDPVLTNLSAK